MCVGVVPTAHQHGVEDSRLLLPLALRHHLPLPAAGEVGALGHAAHAGLGAGGAVSGTLCPPLPLPPPPRPPSSHPEADVAEQVEVLGVHAEVLHDLGVVHVVGEVLRDGEVAEAHHLLGGVDDDGAVDAGTAILGALLWEWGMVQWWPRERRGRMAGADEVLLFMEPLPSVSPRGSHCGWLPLHQPPLTPEGHRADPKQDTWPAGFTSNLQRPPMSPVLSKQMGSSPSCRQALMAHSPLLPPPMMATFFAMLRSTTGSLPGDSVGQRG